MNNKKIAKIMVWLLVVCLFVFLGLTTRKMLILNGLAKKVQPYIESNNYYEKIVNNSVSSTTLTEYYCKGDKAVLSLNTTIKATGETRKLINYYEGEKTNTYMETGENKIALLNTLGVPSKIMIIGIDFNDNLWHLFQMAATSSIKSAEWKGKECYFINGDWMQETYIEKETGLMLKRTDGSVTMENGDTSDIVVEFEYEFGKVMDENLIEPNREEYEIQKN